MFFKFQSFEGPSSYKWKDPDTGREFNEPSKAELIKRIVQYRVQNNLEHIEHLSFVLESYWCMLPENAGKCVPIEGNPRGAMGFLKGGIALLRTFLYDSFAPQEVADKRSEQCARCPFNIFPDKGPFVKWSDEVAIASIEDRKSKRHNDLGQCAVCSCPLKAKVFYTGNIENRKDWVENMEAVNCWQLSLMKRDK